jgi:putative addiction module killer protein
MGRQLGRDLENLPLSERIQIDTLQDMYSVQQTQTFAKWLFGLRDMRARARIIARVVQAESGNLGDVKSVGGGVSEMRIDVGPGYRLYYCRRGEVLIILLVGGDKSTQAKDIKRAQAMLQELEE